MVTHQKYKIMWLKGMRNTNLFKAQDKREGPKFLYVIKVSKTNTQFKNHDSNETLHHPEVVLYNFPVYYHNVLAAEGSFLR